MSYIPGGATADATKIDSHTVVAPLAGDDGKFLKWDNGAGQYVWAVPTDTNTDTSIDGHPVVAPLAGDNGKFLKWDNAGAQYVWDTPVDTNTDTTIDGHTVVAPTAPDNGKFLQWDNAGSQYVWATPSAGSGNATSTGALGSEPGSPTTGDVYFPNNSYFIERYSGAAWVPWGPIFPCTYPPAQTGQTTTLSGNGGSITSGATSFIVASSTGFPATPFLVSIGTEDIKVTAVVGTTWTVVRGYNGTTAASHTDGDTITEIRWEWVNQGGATVATVNGGITLSEAGQGNTLNLRIRKRLAPSTPYTITALCLANYPLSKSALGFGLLFRQATGGAAGQMHLFGIVDTQMRSSKYVSATSFNAHYASVATPTVTRLFLRIADNGTNRICSYSMDGIAWQVFHTITRLDFLTGGADEIGFWINSQNVATPNLGMDFTILSWVQA